MSAAPVTQVPQPHEVINRIPTRWDLLRLLTQRANDHNKASVSQDELADLLRVSRMTVSRWLNHLEDVDRRLVRLPGQWFHRQKVYQLLGTAPKSPGRSDFPVTSHVTSQPAYFQGVTETPNKESREGPRSASRTIPINHAKERPKDGVWAELQQFVKDRTGQLLQDWQVGFIARDVRRKGHTLTQLLDYIRHSNQGFKRWTSAFAVLVSIARNGLRRPCRDPQQTPRPQTTQHASQDRRNQREEEFRRRREASNAEIMKAYFGENYAVQT